MAQFEFWMTTDLKRGSSQVQVLHGQTFTQDNLGNRVGVVVLDGGEPATLNGTVTGYVIRADGGTVVVAGAVDGNRAYIDLPESAYAVPGQIQIAIRLVSSEAKTVLGAVSAYVQRTATGTIIDPGHVIPSLDELLAKLDDMDDAIAAAEQATSDAQDATDELNNGMGSIIKTQATQPTEPLNKVWVDTSMTVLKTLPEVKDNEISAVDTWSSQKINADTNNRLAVINRNIFSDEQQSPVQAVGAGGFDPSSGGNNSNTNYAKTNYLSVGAYHDSLITVDSAQYYFLIIYCTNNAAGNVIGNTGWTKGKTLLPMYVDDANYIKIEFCKNPYALSEITEADRTTILNLIKCFTLKATDVTLAKPGYAADAEAVGNRMEEFGHAERTIVSGVAAFVNESRSIVHGGTIGTYTNYNTTDFIPCRPGDVLSFNLWAYNRESANLKLDTIAYFDASQNYLDGIYSANGTTGAGAIFKDMTIVPSGARYLKALTYGSSVSDPYVKVLASGTFLFNPINVKVACVGDSLTQGLTGGTSGAFTFAEKPWPVIFKEMLSNRGFNVEVKNFGRRGLSPLTYWQDAIPSTGSCNNPASGEPGDTISFDSSFDCVIIMLGTNGHMEDGGSAQDAQIEAYSNIVEYIMEQTNHHAQIMLVCPIYANANEYEEKIIGTRPTIIALGQKYQIPVIDALYESGLGKYNASVFYNPDDLLHLNQSGYHKLGTFIASRFISLYSTFDMDEIDE
jgi:lysophospholipase L1-like esterase